jgi:hypothetical protein
MTQAAAQELHWEMNGGTIQLRRPDYPAKQRNGQRNLAMPDSDVNRHCVAPVHRQSVSELSPRSELA